MPQPALADKLGNESHPYQHRGPVLAQHRGAVYDPHEPRQRDRQPTLQRPSSAPRLKGTEQGRKGASPRTLPRKADLAWGDVGEAGKELLAAVSQVLSTNM